MPSDHRLHPSSILFAVAGSLRAFLLPAVVLLVTTGRSSPDPSDAGFSNPAAWVNRSLPGDLAITNWQFWILLFVVPTLIVALLNYLSFRLRYEGTELVIRSGVFFRNERHVPYARIQNLDAVRNPAHRLFGVAEVRVETGGGQTPEATISVLHESVFEEMRRRIFDARTEAAGARVDEPDTASAPAVAEPRTLLHLPLRELLLNGLLDNRGMVLIAAASGVLWEAGILGVVADRLATGLFRPGLMRETARELATGDIPAVLARIVVLVVGIIAVLALVRLASMLWSLVRLYDFRLTRVGEDARTEYGLLTRITATIPLKRVQSLTVKEAPLQRLLERMSIRVETAGGHGAPGQAPGHPREMLAPIVRAPAVPSLVHEVLPGFTLDGLDWQPLHPRAFRRAVKPPLVVAAAAAAPFVFWLGWVGLFVLPFIVAWLTTLAWMYVRHTQWALRQGSGQPAAGDALVLRSGWLWREITVVPIAKIQALDRVESPFDRWSAMAGVRVDTAGSASPAHRISIPYLARETAAALYDRLAAQIAQTPFRW